MSTRPLPQKNVGGGQRAQRENQIIEELKRLRPIPSVGTLTQETTQGVVRQGGAGAGRTAQDSLVWL